MRFARTLLLAATLAISLPAALAQDRLVNGDTTELPDAVQATIAVMLAAARSGDVEALQAIIDEQERPIQLGFGGASSASEFALANSQTGDGLDVLADLVDILELPFEAVDDGEGGKFYVWPYLNGADLTALEPADKVAAYQLVAPDALPDFIEYGGWLAMRTIIDEDGTWQAWVLGD